MYRVPVDVGEELDVTIEAVGEKGDGIAKKDGFILFVPGVKQGDKVRIRVTKVLKKVGFAEVVTGEAPAEGRAEEARQEEAPVEESAPGPAPEDTEDFGDEAPAEESTDTVEEPAEQFFYNFFFFKMRLFIAFDVSDEVKDYFKQIQKQLPDSKSNLVKEFHLTLRFLGECDVKETKDIIKKLKQIKFDSFKAKTAELGVFPGENFIRVVWVALEPKDKVIALQKSIEEKLNLTKDERFHPHITLARIKFLKNKQDYIKRLKAIKTKELEFKVSTIKLIKSELTPQGPVHEVVEEFKGK